MDNDNEKRIKEKLRFFYEEHIEVHVEKKDREFFNGILVKPRNDDESIWLMQEKKVGVVLLFVCDIFEVSEFRERKQW